VSTIKAHSRRTKEQCLNPGVNFKQLAHFLSTAHMDDSSSRSNFEFLVVHNLAVNCDEPIAQFGDITQHAAISRLPLPTPRSGQICFMRGFPAPAWLRIIGSHYRIDPEYFRRHLDFLEAKKHHDLPPILSNTRNIVRLRATDIFLRQAAITSQEFRTQRQEEKQRVRNYHKRLANFGAVGDTLIRHFSVHNQSTFTLEYDISICVTGSNAAGWTGEICSSYLQPKYC
jgi:hypothetical protein